ncbi:MAG: iron-containing alcohol dehydrogenase [Gemmataceae bacterium]
MAAIHAASAKQSSTPHALPPFDSRLPTRVVFGIGTLGRLANCVRDLGGSRVLLVTDPGLEAAGHPQRALQIMQDDGLEVWLFDAVEENPTNHHVEAGRAYAKKCQIDFLVAVGGGSSMDCAKGINFLLTNGGTMADYVGFGKAVKPMFPSIGIPTTAGTGSEAQSFALIADDRSHMKMACGDPKAAFRLAILDPEVTVSQPTKVTAVTGIDALSHAVESYVTTRRNPLSQTFARSAWQLLSANLDTVLQYPNDLEARGATQIGAHFAGMAIENSMLGACHACANPLTAHYGLTHGIAIGILLPHVIRYNAEVVGPLYGDLAHEAGIVNGDSRAAAEELAGRIMGLMKTAELPTTLSTCGVSEGILPLLAEEAAQQWTNRFNPRPATQADLLGLFQAAF